MIRSYLLSILSGVMLAASFPDAGLWVLGWVALVPLLWVTMRSTPRSVMGPAYAGGVAFYWSLLYWINNVTLAGFLVLTLYLALYFPLFSAGLAWVRRKTTCPVWIVAPVWWAALEYVRTYAFTGLPWGVTGASQYRMIPLIQVAAFTGVYGVSFLVVLGNAAVYELFARRGKRRIRPLLVTVVVVSMCAWYGGRRVAESGDETETVRVAIVQGNVPEEQKGGRGFKERIRARFLSLTMEAGKENPDLIVWPETAVPGYFRYDIRTRAAVTGCARSLNTPILLGSNHVEENGATRYYNSAFYVDARGEVRGRYDKIHLVLFGEIVPWKRFFPFLLKMVPYEEDFTPGTEAVLFPFEKGAIGVLICFEDIFPDRARACVKKGARLLVNITNDAWFGRTGQPYQHAAHAVFRSVENGVSMVRATNTGLSCYIDLRGRIYHILTGAGGRDIFVAGTEVAQMRLREGRTFFTRWGNLFAGGCMGVMAMLFGWCILCGRRKKRC